MSSHSERPFSLPAAPNEPADEGLTPARLWQIAQKRIGLFTLVVVACVGAATFYATGRMPNYVANAIIQIDPDTPRPLAREVERVVNFTEYWSNQQYFDTQIKIISSRAVISQVVKNLALHRDRSFIQNVPRGKAEGQGEPSENAAINALRARLGVEPQGKTRLVRISFSDADPERARRVAAAVVDTFIQSNLNELDSATQAANTWLRTQLSSLKEELEDSELTLHKYKKKNQMLSVSYDDQSNMLREQIGQLGAKITEVRAQREKLAARHKALASITPESADQIPTGELLASSLLGQLRTSYISAVRERESLLATGKGQRHPLVQAATSKLETVQVALMAELGAIQEGVKRDLDALEIELGGLVGLYETAKAQALDLNLREIEYKRLERFKDNNEKLYSLVLESSTENDLTSLLQTNNIRTIDAPQKGVPVGTGTPVIIGIGLLVGLILGIGAATGRELLDSSVKSPEELERSLALPMLGFLPKNGAGSRSSYYGNHSRKRRKSAKGRDSSGQVLELAVHEYPTGALAEAARALRTNITFTAPDKPYRRLLVASPGPGEGKTTVACWIAIAMAQAGQRVLLMDCDLRRPRIHKIFRKPREHGVSEAVLDRSLLDRADLATEVPNLSVLTSGPHVPNAAEILGSDSFQKLLDELSKRFDRIIMDSPPITAVTDATILSALSDGTVFVVRAFATSREVARRSVRALRDVGSHIVGSVLNGADPGRGGKGYYYYYQGNYGRDEDAA